MPGDLGRLTATLEARVDRFSSSLTLAERKLDAVARSSDTASARVTRSFGRMDRAAEGLSRTMGTIARGAAVAAAALAFFVRGQLKAIDATAKLSELTGIAADDLKRYEVAVSLSGGSAEAAAAGLTKFARSFGQLQSGTGDLRTELDKLDPAFARQLIAAKTTGEAIRLFADRVGAARSEQERLQLTMAAFGRSGGKAFAVLFKDGAAGVDELTESLERMGIGVGLSELGPRVERFNDQLETLKEATSSGLIRGLLGVGEGLDNISDALDENTIRRIGELADGFGQLVADAFAAAKELFRVADALAEYNRVVDEGGGRLDAITAAARAAETTADLQDKALASAQKAAALREQLSDQRLGGATADITAKTARQIELAELDLERINQALRVAQARDPFVGPPRERLRLSGGVEPGDLGLTDDAKKTEAAFDRLTNQQAAFVANMRESALGAITEAEKLSLKLDAQLGKIDEAVKAGTLSATDAVEFRVAAVNEATEAMLTAEHEALVKQQGQVSAFLQQYGDQAVGDAEQIAQKISDALDKIPELTDQQRKDLELASAPTIERARVAERGSVDIEFAQRAAELDQFGVAAERSLQALEARLESSDLDEKIAKAYFGDDAKIAELQARNHALLEKELALIESSWDETVTAISELGEKVFSDFLQGIAQGSDATFDDMVRAFALGLLQMEAAALASDIFGALTGKGSGGTSLTGQLIGAIGGKLSPESGSDSASFVGPPEPAQAALTTGLGDAAGEAADKLVGAFRSGVGLLEAGGGALTAALGAGGQLVLAAIQAGAAALAAASAATTSFLGLAEGGVIVGEAGPESILSLDKVPALFAKGGSSRGAAALARQTGERVSSAQVRDLPPGTLVVPDKKMEPLFAAIGRRMGASGGVPKLARGGLIVAGGRARMAEGGLITGSPSVGAPNIQSGGVEVNFNLTQTSGPPIQVQQKRVEKRGPRIDIYAEAAVADTRRGGPGAKATEQRFGLQPQIREV